MIRPDVTSIAAPRRPSFSRLPLAALAQAAGLAAAAAVLSWTARHPRAPEPLPGLLAGPWLSVALVLALVWVVPGLALSRLARSRAQGVERAASALALGLVWLLLPCVGVLIGGGSLDTMLSACAALDVLLLAAWLLHARAIPAAGRAVPPEPGRRLAWITVAVVALVLVAVAAGVTGFTFGGDEWYLMAATRYFLEAREIEKTFSFDAWSLLLAFVVRLAGVDLVDAYRVLLPPFLVAAAAVSALALGRALLRRWSSAALAVTVQGLYALSDMHTRGDGAGMALLVRINEDKFMALTVAVPLALWALVRWARVRERAAAGTAAAAALAAVVLHPLSLLWIGLPALGLLPWRRWRTRAALAAAAAVLAAVAAAFVLRALRPLEYFALHAPDWPLNEHLLAQTWRQVILLPWPEGWLMGHPALLAHPLEAAALLAALALAPGARRSPRRRVLAAGTLLPVLLVFTPPLATLLAGWITPWMVPRVLWAMPVSLVLAAALERARARLRRGGLRLPAPALPLAAAVVMGLALAPRIEASLAALQARNRVQVGDGERALMQAVAADPRVAGTVFAPRGLSVRLPAWSSRVNPLPGINAVRVPEAYGPMIDDARRFLSARRMTDREAHRLLRWDVRYVVVAARTALDGALSGQAAFRTCFRGDDYVLYAWSPERWPGSPSRTLPQPPLLPPR
jgi:hypothetical protein